MVCHQNTYFLLSLARFFAQYSYLYHAALCHVVWSSYRHRWSVWASTRLQPWVVPESVPAPGWVASAPAAKQALRQHSRWTSPRRRPRLSASTAPSRGALAVALLRQSGRSSESGHQIDLYNLCHWYLILKHYLLVRSGKNQRRVATPSIFVGLSLRLPDVHFWQSCLVAFRLPMCHTGCSVWF